METRNYGERTKFSDGTDKTFIYRGGLEELLLPLSPSTPGPPQFLSSLTSLVPLLAPTLQGDSLRSISRRAACLQRHAPAADTALSLEQQADARRNEPVTNAGAWGPSSQRRCSHHAARSPWHSARERPDLKAFQWLQRLFRASFRTLLTAFHLVCKSMHVLIYFNIFQSPSSLWLSDFTTFYDSHSMKFSFPEKQPRPNPPGCPLLSPGVSACFHGTVVSLSLPFSTSVDIDLIAPAAVLC